MRDRLLVVLTVAAGAVDAVSLLGLGRVFTANMTGNLVLLGAAAGQAAGEEVLRSLVALAGFGSGVVAASRYVRPAPRGGWPRAVTVALAVESVLLAGFLAGWVAAEGRPGEGGTLALIAVSATAMGVQTAAVRALAVAGVTTTYVTGTLTAALGDLAAGSAEAALRLGAVLLGLLVGAALGALLLDTARAAAPVLPVAAVALVAAAAAVGHRRPAAAAARHRS